MTHHCVVIHTCIYQIGPFRFRLLVTTGELYLLGDNTSMTNWEIPILPPNTANCIGQVSHILSNNLILKAHI